MEVLFEEVLKGKIKERRSDREEGGICEIFITKNGSLWGVLMDSSVVTVRTVGWEDIRSCQLIPTTVRNRRREVLYFLATIYGSLSSRLQKFYGWWREEGPETNIPRETDLARREGKKEKETPIRSYGVEETTWKDGKNMGKYVIKYGNSK